MVQHAALTDPETRYRQQRYADLAVNPEVRENLPHPGCAMIAALRQFLDERGFLEVETPSACSPFTAVQQRVVTTTTS